MSTFGGFGAPQEVTSGGNALKFYASVRLNIKRVGFVEKDKEVNTNKVIQFFLQYVFDHLTSNWL